MKIIYYKHQRNYMPAKIPLSNICFSELTIVFQGSMYYTVQGELIVLQAGDALFMPRGTTRERLKSDAPANYISWNFYEDYPIDLPVKIPNALTNEIKLLHICADTIADKYYADTYEQIAKLLDCILMNLKANINLSSQHPLVKTIKNFLFEHLKEKITLKQISEFAHFSPVYCDIVFKRETGESIIEFLLKRRMEEAQKILTDGTYSLQKVSSFVGFEDYNYFARTFKKHTGYTPGEYRKIFSFSPCP